MVVFPLLSASCVGQEPEASTWQPLGADPIGGGGAVWWKNQTSLISGFLVYLSQLVLLGPDSGDC